VLRDENGSIIAMFEALVGIRDSN